MSAERQACFLFASRLDVYVEAAQEADDVGAGETGFRDGVVQDVDAVVAGFAEIGLAEAAGLEGGVLQIRALEICLFEFTILEEAVVEDGAGEVGFRDFHVDEGVVFY